MSRPVVVQSAADGQAAEWVASLASIMRRAAAAATAALTALLAGVILALRYENAGLGRICDQRAAPGTGAIFMVSRIHDSTATVS